MKLLKHLLASALMLLGLNLLFFLFMFAVYAIPMDSAAGERIRTHVGDSLYIFINDDKSPVFRNLKSYWNDVSTDMLLLNCAVSQTGTGAAAALKDALLLPNCIGPANPEDDIEDNYEHLVYALYYPNSEVVSYSSYSRYWMLVVGVTKLLSIFYDISEIRYFLYFSHIALIVAIICLLQKRFGFRGTVPFAAACGARVFLMHSVCISTMPDILITLLFMLALLLPKGSNATIAWGGGAYWTVIPCFSSSQAPSPLR